MSTRGTYQFRIGRYGQATVYIHHDNYPAYAWIYFYRAHMLDGRGGLPSDFLRANDGAEITESHEAHGDTEYRYDLDGHTLTVHERVNYSEEWRVMFRGHYCEFINAQAASDEGKGFIAEYCPDFTPLYAVPLYAHGAAIYQSRLQLVALVNVRQIKLDEYRAKFPQYVGNIDSMAGDLERARDALAVYDQQAIEAKEAA